MGVDTTALQGPRLRHLLLLRRRRGRRSSRTSSPSSTRGSFTFVKCIEVVVMVVAGGLGSHHRRHRRRGRPHAAAGGAAQPLPPGRRAGRRGVAGPEGRPNPDARLRHPPRHPHARRGRRASSAAARCGTAFRAAGRGAAAGGRTRRERRRSCRPTGVAIHFGGLKAALRLRAARSDQGDLKGLIGPNGAGKTTAFNVLTGVYLPTAGRRACRRASA